MTGQERPTALIRRVDVSASGQRASGAPVALPFVVAERAMSVKPCACGGRIRADRRFPTRGVADHNRSRLHVEWRLGREDCE